MPRNEQRRDPFVPGDARASTPPTSTPNALSIRLAVSAVLATPIGVPNASFSATTE